MNTGSPAPTQIGRFRRDIGEDGMELLLKATIDTAVDAKAVKPAELERVIVDTTVQEKAIAHPVDSRLLEIARHKVVAAAKRAGIQLKQTLAASCGTRGRTWAQRLSTSLGNKTTANASVWGYTGFGV